MFCIAADKLGVPRPCCIQNDMSLNERSFEGDVAEACHYLCRNRPYGAFDRLHHVLVDFRTGHHFGVVGLPYGVLSGGTLTGKYLDGTKCALRATVCTSERIDTGAPSGRIRRGAQS